ncbi:6-pyruvoyl trahydropterin synthase family protein [Halapricum desulfuricans]|uniref:6-pyruvoyl-tetrahydropterin synthase n=1 Tax=Halapricum desulfuricans TaxID=2841257 RepID=A0A897NF43_9EURY|nr:6-pyruvoyl tetrahydropterin synthase family protein [Halapricum desulfuricans]QSG09608.1 6-pyruvoyl-tetrahydropterin synthase [Halapricum desulfuricans]QSG11312.1 6-pyruvoyl-tetrahydropterin synthase [Halapricum desulfuricans]
MPDGVLAEENVASDTETSTAERTLVVGQDRPIRISTGHRLRDHDGKCSRPHGHNYEFVVEVTGELTEQGWVVDKGDITSVLYEWDHQFLLERGDPLVDAFEQSGDGDAVVVLERPPTAEVMGLELEAKMLEAFPDTVSDVSVQVCETSELCASD